MTRDERQAISDLLVDARMRRYELHAAINKVMFDAGLMYVGSKSEAPREICEMFNKLSSDINGAQRILQNAR